MTYNDDREYIYTKDCKHLRLRINIWMFILLIIGGKRI